MKIIQIIQRKNHYADWLLIKSYIKKSVARQVCSVPNVSKNLQSTLRTYLKPIMVMVVMEL